MKIPKEVMTAHLAGEAVLLHTGTKAYFKLNDTAAELWKGIEAGEDVDGVVRLLTGAFDVDAATARTEVMRVLGELEVRGLLQL